MINSMCTGKEILYEMWVHLDGLCAQHQRTTLYPRVECCTCMR